MQLWRKEDMVMRIVLLCLLSLSALADEVRLKNGDRITGEIREVTRERVIVRADYARRISIELDEVQSVAIVDADGNVHEIGPLEVPVLNLKAQRDMPGVDYTGRVFGSAVYERGDAPTDRLFLRGELIARAREYRYELSGRIERRAEPPTEASTAGLAEGNYDRFLDSRRFVYVRASLEHDRPKDLDLRATAGVGYGLQVLESRTVSLSLRGGLDYVADQRFVGEDSHYPALGWGVKASFLPRRRDLELFHEQDGFWNLENTRIVIVRSRSGLRVPIVEHLKASVQLKLDWERSPSPRQRSTDSTLLFGLDYDF